MAAPAPAPAGAHRSPTGAPPGKRLDRCFFLVKLSRNHSFFRIRIRKRFRVPLKFFSKVEKTKTRRDGEGSVQLRFLAPSYLPSPSPPQTGEGGGAGCSGEAFGSAAGFIWSALGFILSAPELILSAPAFILRAQAPKSMVFLIKSIGFQRIWHSWPLPGRPGLQKVWFS